MGLHDVIRDHFRALELGDAALAATVLAPDHHNRRAADEPPACSVPGVPGFMATSAWLRFAIPDLHFEVLGVVVEDELAVAHVRMQGHQRGAFVVFDAAKGSPQVFPPTGRPVDVEQCHLFRLTGSRTVGHNAVRDDLGMMRGWGYIPPQPRALLALAWWKLSGRAARAAREVVLASQRAADLVALNPEAGVAA